MTDIALHDSSKERQSLMFSCPCDSGRTFSECCEPYLNGVRQPETAEVLMRSRYCAYVKKKLQYIHQTHDPKSRDQHDLEEARKWAEDSEWLGLEIVETEKGGVDDNEGIVEFIARYKIGGDELEHHERSEFRRENGVWYFHDGKMVGGEPFRREEPKVGRNDACPCGSGKKFKKCCGKA